MRKAPGLRPGAFYFIRYTDDNLSGEVDVCQRRACRAARCWEAIAALGVAAGPGKAFANTHTFSPVQRDFSDPYLELIRLLKEGAEIEHDLMVQYLYGAFSLKPAYAELVGTPTPNATSLMGVIVEEMRHLAAVNRLLVELEAKPVLTRQDFPYETDVYPFPFELAPLGQTNLAKFVYCEADKTRLKRARSVVDDSVS